MGNFGDKFNKAEVDDTFGEFEVDDDGFIASKDVIGLFVAGGVRRRRKKHPHQLKKHPQKHPQKRPPMMVPRKRRRRRRPPSKKITNYTIVIFIYRSEFSSSCYPQLTSTTKNLEISEYNDLLKDHSRYKYNSHK